MKTVRHAAEFRDLPPAVEDGAGVKFEKTITVRCPIFEAYAFWRNLNNLPNYLKHVQSITERDAKRSHWMIRVAEDRVVEWDAEIIEDRPNEIISWRSLPNSEIQNAGSVWFSEAMEGGTCVKLSLKYSPPGGKLGIFFAKLAGKDAKALIEDDLRRVKSFLETAGPRPATGNAPDKFQI